MRLALFEISEMSCAVALDKVLHVLTDPQVFKLPLLRACFAGGIVYQDQVVPLVVSGPPDAGDDWVSSQPGFVLVCEAEFGLLGVPAERIVRITKAGEVDSEVLPENDSQDKMFEIDGRNILLLDLNAVLDCPDFTICRLRD